jgi:hypothetical protein
MTLLSIAQSILKETKSSQIPTTIINNSQDSAKQVLRAIEKATIDVSRAFDWQQLQKEKTFASVASTQGYDLPTDFDRIIDNTFWNVDQNREVIAFISSKEWRVLQNSTVGGGSVADYSRIRDGQTLIFPTPSSVVNYIYEYITDLIVEDSGGTGQTGYEADTDVPVVDNYLVQLNATWRLLKMQGKPYAEEQRDYDLNLIERIARNGGNRTIYPASTSTYGAVGYPNTIIAPS